MMAMMMMVREREKAAMAIEEGGTVLMPDDSRNGITLEPPRFQTNEMYFKQQKLREIAVERPSE